MLEKKIQDAWDFVFTKLLHPETNQIYDYRTSEGDGGAFRHLPTPEEIADNIPNPCGWKSGMEDSDINGGIMLDAIIDRYEVTADETMKALANQIFCGLMLNASVSQQEGFLARAVSPFDKKSHYINSSRDQYTHWIYAMVHFYDSPLSNDAQRAAICEKLVAIARKAERDVTEENGYSLLREDGKPAMACAMMYGGVMWHESLRLAMFYAAAYYVSGDRHWLDMYKSVRDWGLDTAEAIDLGPDRYRIAFCLMQMQLSLRFVYDHEQEATYRQRYLSLMQRVAEKSEQYAPESAEALRNYPNYRTVISWRDCPKDKMHRMGTSHGYCYDYPDLYLYYVNDMHRPLRNGAEGLIIQCLTPGYKIKKQQSDAFEAIAQIVDFMNCFNFCPVGYVGAYWAMKRTDNV